MGEQQIVSPIKTTKLLSDQVYSYLKELLIDGRFSPGQKLPSENSLAKNLNVSRVSLREALKRLEIEGYITRKRGVGTFVIDRHPHHMEAGIEKLISMSEVIRSRGLLPGTKEFEIFTEPADEETAKQLNLEVSDPVTVVNRVRTLDNIPFMYDCSRLPSHIFPASTPASSIGESLFKYVEDKLGLKISHAVSRLLPAQSDEFLSEKLQVPIGTLMIKLSQVHYLIDDSPFWQATLCYPDSLFNWYIVRTR